MSEGDEIHLGLDLLDRQVVDRNGVNCGKVDDLELVATDDGTARVAAVLVGTAAWPERLGGVSGALVGAWLRLLGVRPAVHVPAGDVVDVSSRVVLAHDRSHYGLDEAEQRLYRLVHLVPGHRP
jgi:sporulation protein YlmC with PRC-barrel domain